MDSVSVSGLAATQPADDGNGSAARRGKRLRRGGGRKKKPPKKPGWKRRERLMRIDRVFLVLFPLLFAAFNAVYWLAYYFSQDRSLGDLVRSLDEEVKASVATEEP